jgi:hypothetical protein
MLAGENMNSQKFSEGWGCDEAAKHALLREADNERYSKPVRIFAGDQPIEVGFARFDHLLGAWVEPETLEPLAS